ncbi:hypothetical protein PR001_g29610 [Phytophthora rubi]|uniref:Uncharacterized protein n=2 Tax=Phytophthora rubi TaxID=129364 RepID=A0A6A3H130_9STRA|nr:hypothetical protein PR001_g29610 [Phytophthora rubi]
MPLSDLYVITGMYVMGRCLLTPGGGSGDDIATDKGIASLNEGNFVMLLFTLAAVDRRLH